MDVARFVASFQAVVAHFDVLRTTLPETDDSVVLAPAANLPATEVIHLERGEVEKWANERSATPLDMRRCGYDSALLVHDDGTSSWYLCLHHVLTDATSSSLVFAATGEVYAGRALAPARSYYDWSAQVQTGASASKQQNQRAVQRAREYWAQRSPAPRIGRLYKAPERSTARAARVPLEVTADLMDQIRARLDGDLRMLTDHLGWTTLLTTATALYLHRVTGADEFAIGLPVHNRSSPERRGLVGPLVEVFPVDITISPEDTGRTLHKRVGRSIMKTLQFALPGTAPIGDFETVVNVIPQVRQERFGSFPAATRWIHPGAIDGTHLLRLQMTSYESTLTPPDVPALRRNAKDPTSQGTNSVELPQATPWDTLEMPTVDLQRFLESNWEFALDISQDACGIDQLGRAPQHMLRTLSAIVSKPDEPIGLWHVLDRSERDIVERWGRGPAVLREPTSGPVGDLRRALLNNTGVALQDGNRTFTGPQLWRWVETTAQWMRNRGVSPGDRIGVDLGRCAEAVVAIFASLAAGASFVPLDPTQPSQRRRLLAERANCQLVISDASLIESCRTNSGEADVPFELGPDEPDDEAYVIFTSGSTGEPKGVPITRGGLVRYLDFACDRYTGDRRPGLVAPLFSPLTFDLTITTLFVPFLAGGRVIVIAQDGPRGLAQLAQHTDITWCKATPSHLEILIRLLPVDHRLTTIIVGGEAFASRLAADLLAGNPEREIHNEYGPTEAVVGCMDYNVEPNLVAEQADVPIGRPAPGVDLAVVDQYLQPVPLGSPGELLISSPGLTTGYLHQSDAEDPFVELDGQRWYRSGDLVRLQDPERLVYLGRRDEQVKVGGIRLEPTEVEAALAQHPAIDQAVVRLWSPAADRPKQHCVRCGLPDNVPGVKFDPQGVCDTCHDYDRVAPIASSWFRTPEQLIQVRDRARSRRSGKYDCLHLLSGGKDSTFALYKLVEMGFKPYSLTLDNGFISEGAKANVARSIKDLGIDHEFITVEAMNEIFRDSLDRHSNVCHGCYKTIYTVAVNKATELGIPLIVTGLSRGQLFETRLIPQQFSAERFDPEAIDRAVAQARRVYHRADDAPRRLLDTSVFDDDEVFERIEYLDFYRYVDVELSDMLRFLDQRAPWVRPKDTGRSTNCLINAAGIHTHREEQGFHNYAVPYAWDVRLGHKTRNEAIEELDDRLDLAEVNQMLDEVGYSPRPRRFLTAWLRAAEGQELPSPSEVRTFLSQSLPTHAIPSAFVAIDDLPLSTNGKLDVEALPAPSRIHRSSASMTVPAATATEAIIVELWERILGIEPIGTEDDFFALGGDSLAALQMTVALSDQFGTRLSDDLAFVHTTPQALGVAVDDVVGSSPAGNIDDTAELEPASFVTESNQEPELSDGELAVLFDQAQRPDDVMYNVARVYRISGILDGPAFETALREVAACHQPLTWSFSSPRRRLSSSESIACDLRSEPIAEQAFEQLVSQLHLQPFDTNNGPLLRATVQPLDSGSTAVVMVIHHASGDAASFDRLWEQIDVRMSGGALPELPVDYASIGAWQRARYRGPDGQRAKAHHLAQAETDRDVAQLSLHNPTPSQDGFLTRVVQVTPERLRAATRNSTAAAALGLLAGVLGRYHDGDDLELGLITSTRDHRDAEQLFGYFLNTIPVRLPAGPGQSADGSPEALNPTLLADRGASAIGGALAFRSYPRAAIAADRRAAGLGDVNLDVLVSYDDLPALRFQGAPVRQKVLWNGSAVAPLTFFIEARPGQIDISVEYQGSRVPRSVAEQMLEAWAHTLTVAAEHPTLPIDETFDRFLYQRNELALLHRPSSPNEGDTFDRVVDQFQRSDAAAQPAVECGSRILTWAELDQRSTELAAALIARGVVVGDRVAVNVGREIELVVALVAIGRIGASYVPIDPTHPEERREQAIDLARAVALVTQSDSSQTEPALVTIPINAEAIDGRRWGSDPTASEQLRRYVTNNDDFVPGREAYLIFTSGSTGTPRGVPVSVGHLTTSTEARREVYTAKPNRFLMPSSPAFDSSIVGLYWTLSEGGTVVLPTERSVHDIDALLDTMADVDHVLLVPTLYRALLDRSMKLAGPGVKESWPAQIIVAGETCPASLVADHYARYPNSSLTNEYGPTEATVWATAHHCRPGDDPIPIGPPIPGATVAVVDRSDRLRPLGVQGSLLVGGDGVVEGYLDNPEATASSFASLSFPGVAPGGVFRTGDQGVIVTTPVTGHYADTDPSSTTDATVLYLGRVDNRLNVGGLRVEPEEIEAALLAVEAVSAAVVDARDVRSRDQLLSELEPSAVSAALQRAANAHNPADALDVELRKQGRADIRLVAHVEASSEVTEADLRAAAKERLPAALRPGRYVLRPNLPRTPNGKVDRSAVAQLPLPSPTPASAARTASPDTELSSASTSPSGTAAGSPDAGDARLEDLQDSIRSVFVSVLRTDGIGLDDSFFDHGGHSLLAMELVLAVEDQLGARFGPGLLYDHPTVRGLTDSLIESGILGSTPSDHRNTTQDSSVPSRRPTNTGLLIPIQAQGSRPPIFAVHVLGIDCAFFRPLAARLGNDQPMFGLGQPRTDLDLDTSAPTAVRSVAVGYADEIERVVPEGPIALAAISLGSVVAWELALELRRRRREVQVLAMFDALGPDNILNNLSARGRLSAHWARASADPARYTREQSERQLQRARRIAERASLATQRRLGMKPSHRLEVRQFIENNIQSQFDYDFESYDGRVLVVKAADDPLAEAHLESSMGWTKVAHGPLDIALSPGGHLSMMEEPHVASVADALAKSLTASLATQPTPKGASTSLEAELIGHLHAGELPLAAARLAMRSDLSADDAALVSQLDRLLKSLASASQRASDRVASALSDDGLETTSARLPSRMTHPLAIVHIDADAKSENSRQVASAIATMDKLGFRPVLAGESSQLAASALAEGQLEFVSRSGDTERVQLRFNNGSTRDSVDGRGGSSQDLGVFLGTPSGLITPLLRFAELTEDQLLIDLGCGDGRVLIAAAKQFGAQAIGYESDPQLAELARQKIASAGLTGRISIVESDARQADLDEADVVFAFLPPAAVSEILVNALTAMKPGSRFISHEQLPGITARPPNETKLVFSDSDTADEVAGITVAMLWMVDRA